MSDDELDELYYEIQKDLPAEKQTGLYKLRAGYEDAKKKAECDAGTFYIKAAAFGLIPIAAVKVFRYGIPAKVGDILAGFIGGMLVTLLPFSIYYAGYTALFKNAGKFTKAVYTVIGIAIAVYLAYHGI